MAFMQIPMTIEANLVIKHNINTLLLQKRSKLHILDISAALDNNNEDNDEMFPPHEIVARGLVILPKTTFSVLEGVWRTLKGRDLRQVCNAVQNSCI